MTSLSREALQILELMPQWQRRQAYRPQGEVIGQGVLTIGLLAGPSEQRLWAQLTQWLRQLGCPEDRIANALMLPAAHVDSVIQAIAAQPPAVLWSFSAPLLSALEQAVPDIRSRLSVVEWPDVAQAVASPVVKAALWRALIAAKASQWECFSTPINASRS